MEEKESDLIKLDKISARYSSNAKTYSLSQNTFNDSKYSRARLYRTRLYRTHAYIGRPVRSRIFPIDLMLKKHAYIGQNTLVSDKFL